MASAGPEQHPGVTFDVASLEDDASAAATKEDVLAAVKAHAAGDRSVLLLDTLPTSSFGGTGGKGHITGARSLPYERFFTAEGLFASEDEVRQQFASVGIDHSTCILTY